MVLIGAKCPVFPQQRGFDWYEAKFYVSPSNAVLIDAAILYGTCATLDTCLFKEINAQMCLYIVYKNVLSVFTQ